MMGKTKNVDAAGVFNYIDFGVVATAMIPLSYSNHPAR